MAFYLTLNEQFEKRLKDFGYHDVDVKCNFDKTHMYMYFWVDNCRYQVSVFQKHLQTGYENLIEDKIEQNLSMFTNLFSNYSISKECDLRTLTNDFLTANGFEEIRLSVAMRQDGGTAWANKGGFRFQITISRELDETVYQEVLDVVEENIEWDAVENYKEVEAEVESRLKTRGLDNFQICLSEDLLNLDLSIVAETMSCHLKMTLFDDGRTMEYDEIQFDIVNIIKSCWSTCCGERNNPYEWFYEDWKSYWDQYHIFVDPKDQCVALIFIEDYLLLLHTEFKSRLQVDLMDGVAFERFCAKVLSANGFENIFLTQGSGDQGVDIIAYKDDIKYGIQCKCYSADIGNKAVQEVYAGKAYYNCHVGVVLTNRQFTKSAVDLAKKNGVILWDRNKLFEMIRKYQQEECDVDCDVAEEEGNYVQRSISE